MEEALRRRDQDLDAAGEAICGDLVFQQAQDALRRVVVVTGVREEPEDLDARVGDARGRDDLGGVGRGAVQHQIDPPGRIDGQEVLEEGDEMLRQFAVVIGQVEEARGGIQGAEEGTARVLTRGRDANPMWPAWASTM